MGLNIKPLNEAPTAHMFALLISPAKYGKTTAGATLPRPLLVGDVDGGILSMMKKRLIDPAGIYTAPVQTYEEAKELLERGWKEGPDGQPFKSVFIDTFSWLMSNVIKREILAATRREKMERNDWGLYLERGMYLAQRAHALARDPNGCHVVLASHEADKSDDEGGVGKLGPAVSGQLFDILPGMPDYVIFLRMRYLGKSDPVTKRPLMKRVFQLEADAKTPAGSRAEVPGEMEPDFTKLWEYTQGTPQAPQIVGGVV
jgi:hypothetical protein